MDTLYEFPASVIFEVESQIESLAKQEQAIEEAKRRQDKEARRKAEEERDKIHQELLKSDASVIQMYLAVTQEADSDSFRQAWQKWLLSAPDRPLQQLKNWGLEAFYQAKWEHPTIDIFALPQFSWFLQFTFTLAKPYISKDDNPFYIIDNPIVRDKVFRLPMVRSTSWKGNLYSALWQLGHRLDSRWEFRIWGWLPCTGVIKDRDKFLQTLKDQLDGETLWQYVFGNTKIKPKMTEWHDLPCTQTDGRAYLQELSGGAA